MKSFRDFLRESILDLEKKEYDKFIFIDPESIRPTLRPEIKEQIRRNIELAFGMFGHIRGLYIMGSILTKRYSPESDIDVAVLIQSDDIKKDNVEKNYGILKMINGKNAGSSTHPINYYFSFYTSEDEKLTDIFKNADNLYDVMNDRWIKKSREINFSVERYKTDFDKFIKNIDLDIMCLKRNILDLDNLRGEIEQDTIVKAVNRLIYKKKSIIFETVKDLIEKLEKLREERRRIFSKKLTKAQLDKIKIRNNVKENIVYKLLESYGYTKMIDSLKEILEDKKCFDDKDIFEIKKCIFEFTSSQV